jgi:hypothetical protein
MTPEPCKEWVAFIDRGHACSPRYVIRRRMPDGGSECCEADFRSGLLAECRAQRRAVPSCTAAAARGDGHDQRPGRHR